MLGGGGMMSLHQVSQAVQGTLINSADVMLSGVSTDSRSDCTDKLFVALAGDNFDAHDYIDQAQKNGASAAIVHRKINTDLSLVSVKDTRLALGQLAGWWRQQFILPVVGVTGSVGKTTTKEMLKCIFAQLGQGLVTEGNLNNEIGVPLTLFRLKADDQYAIIEMGMNHSGEIAYLSDLAKPTIAVITKAAEAHLENLGTVEAVARAKGEIFTGLQQDGIAVINADDNYADLWREAAKDHQQISFALDAEADVTASIITTDAGVEMKVTARQETFELCLHALGKHNAENALAAIAVAVAAKVPIDKIIAGLSQYQPYKGRLNTLHLSSELLLIDDTYNANPESIRAAIDVLAESENSTLILGDMAELGEQTEKAHQQIGGYAQQRGIKQLFACGKYAHQYVADFQLEKQAFANQELLLTFLSENKLLSGTCLVKGSRSAHMERVVEHIEQLAISNGEAAC